MKKTTIFEFPSNLGLKQLTDKEPGVYQMPDSLQENGFYDDFENLVINRLDRYPYSMNLDEESKVRNGSAIRKYAIAQAEMLRDIIHVENGFALVIGGDCSILIGNTIALKEQGRHGLFFLDGHTDFAWPAISGTGGAAGMDLGIVTGHGHEKLTNINGLKPYIKESDVWCVGNRDFDPLYIDIIEDSEINYIDLHQLRKNKIRNCIKQFLGHVENEELKGFWIHMDVDVLNDEIMPLVDSRAPDGLSYQELKDILSPLLEHSKVKGMNITILDPDLDVNNKYTKLFVKHMKEIFEDRLF